MHDPVGRVVLRDTPGVDDEHLVRERERFFGIMRNDERRELELARNRLDAILDRLLDKAVESRQRLVKKLRKLYEGG